jgi:hypothetical protein
MSKLTTAFGAPVADDNNIMTAGRALEHRTGHRLADHAPARSRRSRATGAERTDLVPDRRARAEAEDLGGEGGRSRRRAPA